MQSTEQAGVEPNSISHPAQPKRSWWRRNWFWVVPVGCLTPVLACGGFFTLLFMLIFGMMKSSHPYQDSLATVQNDQRIITELGTPIEPGFFVTGQVNLQNSSGNADLSYSITGPQGSADVYIGATKSAGQWTYSYFEVELDTTGQRIDMLKNP